MIIKNKAELVSRALYHRDRDHIEQGTFGRVDANGHAKFKGCVIGCLSTPAHEEYENWMARLVSYSMGVLTIEDDYESQLRRLSDEFGIEPALARLFEYPFEQFEYHGEAIEWIPTVAEALPEGANISRDDVEVFVNRHGGEVVSSGTATMLDGMPREPERAKEIGEELIEWLRRGAPVVRTVEIG